MDKMCSCGEPLDIRLRTVIFSSKVTIENVPVYSCDLFGFSAAMPEVKNELGEMIQNLGRNPDKQVIRFNEKNEIAFLLYEATRRERRHIPVEMIVKERVNDLLDLLLLAQSLHDESWTEEVRKRLAQISRMDFAAHDRS